MTRRQGSNLAVALVAVVLAVPAMAAESEVSVSLGAKMFTADQLDDAGLSSGFQYGIRSTLDFGWPVALAFDLLFASDDATESFSGAFPLSIKTDVDTLEFDFGVRRYFIQDKQVRPFVGGGLSVAQMNVVQVQSGDFGPGTEYSNTVVDDEDTSVGYWVSGGFGYFINHFVIGADVRWSNASAKIASTGVDETVNVYSGGLQFAAFLGYSW